MKINRCIHCMEDMGGETAVCPNCGERQEPPEPFYSERWLRPNTILHGRYLVGLHLEREEDTYIALDLARGERVLVKELYLAPLVRREGAAVAVNSGFPEYLENWEQGLPEFLQIGSILLRRPDGLSIPRAREVFQENNTAYIVLDLPERPHKTDLEDYVSENGPLEYESCVHALLPLTKDLAWLREVGAAHRQIDPQHIWVDKAADGQRDGLTLSLSCPQTLNDRDEEIHAQITSDCFRPRNFAPPETYSLKAEDGPWCDVYSLCAVLYFCLTGQAPPNVIERLHGGRLEVCTDLSLPQEQLAVLNDGMALRVGNRIQSMAELGKRLEDAAEKSRLADFPQPVYGPPPPGLPGLIHKLRQRGKFWRK